MRVMLFGTFDGLHDGHLFVLHEALTRGDVTVVVARDANVRKFKGRDPDQPEQLRCDAIQKKFPMMTVTLGDSTDFFAPIRTYNPELILLGYDQKLPPGIDMNNLSCPVERLAALEPERLKSSFLRDSKTS